MATYYVRTSGGNDGNDGLSLGQGFATIGQAITSMTLGDHALLCVMGTGEEFTGESALAFSISGVNGAVTRYSGANSSGEIDGTIAVVNSGVGATVSAGEQIFEYITITGNSTGDCWTTSGAIQGLFWYKCSGNSAGTLSSGFDLLANCDEAILIGCSAINNDAHGFNVLGDIISFYGCFADNNGQSEVFGDGFNAGSGTSYGANLCHCISSNNFGSGFTNPNSLVNCTTYNNGSGVSFSVTGGCATIVNCIFSNEGTAVNKVGGANTDLIANCAFHNNTSDYSDTTPLIIRDQIDLTETPFIAAASGDFRLNNANGGGQLCKGTASPSTIPGSNTAHVFDVGASQSPLRTQVY